MTMPSNRQREPWREEKNASSNSHAAYPFGGGGSWVKKKWHFPSLFSSCTIFTFFSVHMHRTIVDRLAQTPNQPTRSGSRTMTCGCAPANYATGIVVHIGCLTRRRAENRPPELAFAVPFLYGERRLHNRSWSPRTNQL